MDVGRGDLCAMRAQFPTNKLMAIAALAAELASTTRSGGAYLAGLWEHNLIHQLGWHVREDVRTAPSYAPSMQDAIYVAPSWTWASIERPVLLETTTAYDRSSVETKFLVDILRFDVARATSFEFGRVTDGSLHMVGHILQAEAFATEFGSFQLTDRASGEVTYLYLDSKTSPASNRPCIHVPYKLEQYIVKQKRRRLRLTSFVLERVEHLPSSIDAKGRGRMTSCSSETSQSPVYRRTSLAISIHHRSSHDTVQLLEQAVDMSGDRWDRCPLDDCTPRLMGRTSFCWI